MFLVIAGVIQFAASNKFLFSDWVTYNIEKRVVFALRSTCKNALFIGEKYKLKTCYPYKLSIFAFRVS
ncbi:MAG: hypothetical protein CMM44_09785 [Rhodospirillaceae bacterium]|nr:hypothetical protein [Rhodospirillaceae bacterium]